MLMMQLAYSELTIFALESCIFLLNFFGFRFSKAMLRLKSGNPRGCNLVRRKNATLTELLQMLLCK